MPVIFLRKTVKRDFAIKYVKGENQPEVPITPNGGWRDLKCLILIVLAIGINLTSNKNYMAYDYDARGQLPLTKLLAEGNDSKRMEAAKRLGEKKNKFAIVPLIKALNDPHQYVRSWAAWALGEIGDSSAVEPLIQTLAKYTVVSNTDYLSQESGCLTDVYLALEKLSGQKFGLDVKQWQKWNVTSNL